MKISGYNSINTMQEIETLNMFLKAWHSNWLLPILVVIKINKKTIQIQFVNIIIVHKAEWK
jgi:hypothetical protein